MTSMADVHERWRNRWTELRSCLMDEPETSSVLARDNLVLPLGPPSTELLRYLVDEVCGEAFCSNLDADWEPTPRGKMFDEWLSDLNCYFFELEDSTG
jgi:hypothetical protein